MDANTSRGNSDASKSSGGRPKRSAFYPSAGIAAALVVVGGFAPSYYFKFFSGAPTLPWLLHLHGALMSSWFMLFLVQTCLISANRVRWHRRLGAVAAVLAVLIVLVGAQVAIHAAAREVRGGTPDAPFLVAVMGFDIVNLPLFAILVGAGVVMRRRPAYHKRLMLLATLSLLLPPVDRIPIDFIQSNHVHTLSLVEGLMVLCVCLDTLQHRRLHPVFAWGAAAIIVAFQVTYAVAASEWWIRLGTHWVAS